MDIDTLHTLAKQCGQLDDRADLLMRMADVAHRNERRRGGFEVVRRIIRVRLRDGSLPYDSIPATILGCAGDDSPCGVCDHDVTRRQLMMVVTRHAAPHSAPIPFHADCFELWNEEGRVFKTEFMNTA